MEGIPASARMESIASNHNNLIQPLLTDKYQLTMLYGYWLRSEAEKEAVFDLYFRRNPFGGECTIFAGLEQFLRFINDFHFSDKDIEQLKTLDLKTEIKEEFWIYLRNLNAKTLKVYAISEGSVCFPNLPLVRVEGPLALAQFIETTLLNMVNYASLVATNAARYRLAANSGRLKNCKLLEFGLRRSQGPDGGFTASRSAYIGGFDATSNVLASLLLGIPASGTMSHSYVMSKLDAPKLTREDTSQHEFLSSKLTGKKENFTLSCLDVQDDLIGKNLLSQSQQSIETGLGRSSELRAFIDFACIYPENFLVLVDTYDTIKIGLINFCVVAIALLKFGYKPVGIRIDSGDLAYLSLVARELFGQVSKAYQLKEFDELEIIASNDINEEIINSLNDQANAITCLGIGTHLVTCERQPALGCVYKLVEINGTPTMKISSALEKTSIPYKKAAFRLYNKRGEAMLDLITIAGELLPIPGQQILCRHPFVADKTCYAIPSRVEPLLELWWDGKLVKSLPELSKIKSRCKDSLNYLTEDIKRSFNATPFKVSVSENLFRLLNKLRSSLTPTVILE